MESVSLTGATRQYLTTLVCSFHSPALLEKHSLSSRTRKQTSLLCVPESCLQAAKALWIQSLYIRTCPPKHCALTGTGWGLNTLLPTAPIRAVIALCVVYRLCFFSKGQGHLSPAAFHSYLLDYLLGCHDIPYKKESVLYAKTPAACAVWRRNISWNNCTAHERSPLRSPWQEHWLLLLPAGHVVFLHARSIIPIPSANVYIRHHCGFFCSITQQLITVSDECVFVCTVFFFLTGISHYWVRFFKTLNTVFFSGMQPSITEFSGD